MSERPHGADRCHTPQLNSGLRSQTTVSEGSRQAALKEPELLVGGLGGLRCPGSGVPSLALAILGGGDGVDASCLAFLIRRAVEDKKKEEEERKKNIEEALRVQERTQEL